MANFTTNMTTQELIHKLKKTKFENFPKVLANLELNSFELDNYESWSDASYTRNCIFQNDDFEVLLICWNPGQTSAIHNHGNSKCWVHQIDGITKETRYKQGEKGKLVQVKETISMPGQTTYMEDSMGFHRFENIQNEPARTLHVYANPIKECDVFNEEKEQFEPLIVSFNN